MLGPFSFTSVSSRSSYLLNWVRHKSSKPKPKRRKMKFAVEGCCHGELDAIYEHVAKLEKQNKYKIDLLLICGDFQAVRNHQDLQCMSVPEKYRKLGGFCKYYTGEKTAPLLTLVIGGNHEASNYMWELYHGGWLAPNIYFLGNAGVVQVNGIRIGGMSGIYNRNHYENGFFESLPFTYSTMRSIYHIREFNQKRLSLLSKPEVFLSHDWPASIEHHGDIKDLLRRKPFLRDDIDHKELGSPPSLDLIRTLKPDWWFSAHLHVKYEATFIHESNRSSVSSHVKNPDEIVIEEDEEDEDAEKIPDVPGNVDQTPDPLLENPDEIKLDDEEKEVAPIPRPPTPKTKTRFMALDKCIKNSRRQFLEVLDIETPISFSTPRLTFDPEWLAISRAFNPYMSLQQFQLPYPDEKTAFELVARELDWVKSHVSAEGKQEVRDVQVFATTAPGPSPTTQKTKKQPSYFPNPQTAAFCDMLEIENKVDALNMPGKRS